MKDSLIGFSALYGIDTVSFYVVLTHSQKNTILRRMTEHKKAFFTEEDNYERGVYSYRSEYLAEQGIKLRVAKYGNTPWGLYILVHPALALGNTDRAALYQPNKENYKKLAKVVDTKLKKYEVPVQMEKMSMLRADVTINLFFSNGEFVCQYLKTFRKCLLIPHYKLSHFREDDHKAKNPEKANKHSYKQFCKSAAYFAYDKAAQLQMIDKFPESLADKHVLRLEAQLSSKAIRKWINSDDFGKHRKVLEQLVENGAGIHKWYLKRMGLLLGEHLRYEDAVKMVDGVKNEKTRKHMHAVMKALGYNNANLTNVFRRLDITPRIAKKALDKFEKIGISPITVPNDSPIKRLPGLADLIDENIRG